MPNSQKQRIRPTGPGTFDNHPRTSVPTHGGGLLFAADERDAAPNTTVGEHNYFIAPPHQPWLTTWDSMRERWYMLKEEAVLNMGHMPASPAYAWRHWLSMAPNPTMLGPSAMEIMRGSLNHLPLALHNFEGTTIRACADFLFTHGNISTMLTQDRRTASPLELRELVEDWIMNGRGPLILEARWPDSFFDTQNRHIVLKPPYKHPVAVVIRGWSAITDAYARILAPFGPAWGVHGSKQLSSHDLLRLFHEQDDARIITALDKNVGYEASRLKKIRVDEIEALEDNRVTSDRHAARIADMLEDD